MAEIKTKILLRNDETANWESSSLVLSKGEAAVEFTEDSKAKIKIGDGNSTFNALPYVGGDEAQVFQVATLEELETKSANPGDMGIVIAAIGETDKRTYTAYVYDGSAWKAFDGNYDAANVYFDDDLTYTANIGVYTVPSSGSGTIPAEGKNIKEVLSSILAAPKNPTTSQPYITVSGTNTEVEIGTTVNLAYTINTNAGSYTYGPATGVSFTSYSATCNGETKDTKTGTFSVVAETAAKTVSASATHTEGAIPVNNLGTEYPAGQIKAGTKTASGCKVQGVRYMFYGPCTTNIELSSDNIRALTGQKAAAATLTKTAGAGCVKYVVAVPSNLSITEVLLTSSMNADITAEFKNVGTVAVKGAEDYTAADYKVYVYQPAQIAATETYQIKIG